MLLGMISGAILLKGFYYFVDLYKTIRKNEEQRRDNFSETIKALNARMENTMNNVNKLIEQQNNQVEKKLALVLSSCSRLSYTEKGTYHTKASVWSDEDSIKKEIEKMDEYALKKFVELLDKVYNREDNVVNQINNRQETNRQVTNERDIRIQEVVKNTGRLENLRNIENLETKEQN